MITEQYSSQKPSPAIERLRKENSKKFYDVVYKERSSTHDTFNYSQIHKSLE